MRDNLHDTSVIIDLNVKADSKVALKNAVAMCFETNHHVFTQYKVENNKITFNTGKLENGFTMLPFPIRFENAYYFILQWIESLDKDKLTVEYPGGDGSHGLGFVVEK